MNGLFYDRYARDKCGFNSNEELISIVPTYVPYVGLSTRLFQ